MEDREKALVALVSRMIGFLRDHNQHCYTAEELVGKEKIKRGENISGDKMTELCEELAKEGIIEPKREDRDKGRCYKAVR